jgi:hypothetical protein
MNPARGRETEEFLENGVGARYSNRNGRMAERPVIDKSQNALILFIFGIIPAQPSVETS